MHTVFIASVKFILCDISQLIFLHSHESGKLHQLIWEAQENKARICTLKRPLQKNSRICFDYAKSNVPNSSISSNK